MKHFNNSFDNKDFKENLENKKSLFIEIHPVMTKKEFEEYLDLLSGFTDDTPFMAMERIRTIRNGYPHMQKRLFGSNLNNEYYQTEFAVMWSNNPEAINELITIDNNPKENKLFIKNVYNDNYFGFSKLGVPRYDLDIEKDEDRQLITAFNSMEEVNTFLLPNFKFDEHEIDEDGLIAKDEVK